jgi:Na+/alanine symporter
VRVLYVGYLFALVGCFFDFPVLFGFSVYFPVRLHWPQLRRLGEGLKQMFIDKVKDGKMSNFAIVATIIGVNCHRGS